MTIKKLKRFRAWFWNAGTRKFRDAATIEAGIESNQYDGGIEVSLKGWYNEEKQREEISIWAKKGYDSSRLLGTVYIRGGKPVFSRRTK